MRGTLSQGFNDLGTIKLLAEQGDVAAQIKLADAYLANFKTADALKWYEAAAKKGSAEGEYQLGSLLLFGRVGIPQEQSVSARPTEGLKWAYKAATSGKKAAWRDVAKALESGIGCATNRVEAYAWLKLSAEAGDVVSRVEMNGLALKMPADEIVSGENLAGEMKLGHWPAIPAQNKNQSDLGLKLNGLIPYGNKPLATINNQSVAEGETISVKTKKGTFDVKCLKINSDSVVILVGGETEPQTLQMQ